MDKGDRRQSQPTQILTWREKVQRDSEYEIMLNATASRGDTRNLIPTGELPLEGNTVRLHQVRQVGARIDDGPTTDRPRARL